jgi:large subunit ribosomal protein L21
MATFEQAILKTGGKQYRVQPGTLLCVEKLDGQVGEEVQFGEVLLLGQGSDAKVGTPLVQGAKVTGTITAHGRGPKVVVYKFKRRKNYRRKQGHRQAFTEVRVDAITG